MTCLAKPMPGKAYISVLVGFVHQFTRRKDGDIKCTHQRWSVLGRAQADGTLKYINQ